MSQVLRSPVVPVRAEPEEVGRIILRAPRRHLAAAGWTWAHYTARSFTYRFRRPPMDVLFYPERLASMHYVLWKICAVLGLRVTQQLSQRTALAVLWKDATFIRASEAALPVTSAPIINATCLDISKTAVSRHFSAVFGYSCDVDPGMTAVSSGRLCSSGEPARCTSESSITAYKATWSRTSEYR